jgi:serine/threonine protein kinase
MNAANIPQIPGYTVLIPIGRGAYGSVYLAEDSAGRRVALKVVTPQVELSDKMLQRELGGLRRFLTVAESSPYLVRIHEMIENLPCGGFAYAMELADSIHAHGVADYAPLTLRHRLKTEGRMSVQEAIRITQGLCEALEHLHGQGLVHRDVKPGNVIFVHGQPKLADLGLISGEGDSTSAVGTRGYHAPEGARGPKADLFSLGKVLYEMATGCDRQDFPELPQEFPSFADSRALLALNPILAKACTADPAKRYPSAARFKRDLLMLQTGKSLGGSSWGSWGAGAVLLITLGWGLGRDWWQHQEEQRFWDHLPPVERINRAYQPEAAASWRRHFIPSRPKGLEPRQIDLTAFYNGALSQSLFLTLNPSEAMENTWGTLPKGSVSLGGIPFDIRGVIHLSGQNLESRIPKLMPATVTNIPVAMKCQRIHFVGATQWGDPPGTVVCRYRMHYADGTSEVMAVEFEWNVQSWWLRREDNQGDLKRAKRVGQGSNARLDSNRWTLSLYLQTWNNPKPDLEVKSIDLESAMLNSSPFVAGITVE